MKEFMVGFLYFQTKLTDLCRSKALTVPSREAPSTTLPEELNVTPVTAEECSENVTKQNPEDVFHSLTCTQHVQHS